MEIKNKDSLSSLQELATNNLKKSSSSEKKQALSHSENHADQSFAVKLSPEALMRKKIFDQVFHVAAETNPIREDRVNEIREQLALGTYKIDSGRIADGMLREALLDELSKNPEVLL